MYAELNRLVVGSGQIPLNIELKHDDNTVCCSHTVVQGRLEKKFPREVPREIRWSGKDNLITQGTCLGKLRLFHCLSDFGVKKNPMRMQLRACLRIFPREASDSP